MLVKPALAARWAVETWSIELLWRMNSSSNWEAPIAPAVKVLHRTCRVGDSPSRIAKFCDLSILAIFRTIFYKHRARPLVVGGKPKVAFPQNSARAPLYHRNAQTPRATGSGHGHFQVLREPQGATGTTARVCEKNGHMWETHRPWRTRTRRLSSALACGGTAEPRPAPHARA